MIIILFKVFVIPASLSYSIEQNNNEGLIMVK